MQCLAGQICYADCTACPAVLAQSAAPTISPKPTTPAPTRSPTTPRPTPLYTCNTALRNTVNFGYYQSWAIYRSGSCNPLSPGDIDVTSFGYTHLAFAFAGINYQGLIEPYNGSSEFWSMYTAFNSLKASNPGLNTLIAVGGWTFDQSRFVYVSSTSSTRSAFAASVVTFLESNNFDGIDLDWEYPVTRQGTPADYANYPLLCQALRTAFDAAGHTDWLITIATSINPDKLAQGYDMAAMAPHIDWFNVMSYDIHGSWDTVAGANADMPYIQNTLSYIFGLGVPREKLVLGLAAYGRSMTLSSTSCTTDGCPISGAGLTGCHTEAGNLPYFQIDETYVQTGNYDSLILNPISGSMELVTGGNRYFTSYDSPETWGIKYRYGLDNCLRGIMWWAVDLIKQPIDFFEVAPSTSPSASLAPTTETRSPTSRPTTRPTMAPTVKPPCGAGCPVGSNSLLPTLDCLGFYYCVGGSASGVINCPAGTIFDVGIQGCNWAYAVTCQCTSGSVPTTPSPTTQVAAPTSQAMCTACPATTWAMVGAADCSGFYHCINGSPSYFIACPDGTLWSEPIKGCDYPWRTECTCSV
eukprot:CCRYP_014683-RB/>CCRYP_014683-RB protein AED:0.01 eAED:0.01 QI:737/1/1/1/1/0.66/3/469/581